MGISNGRKAIYITISILLALALWFYVNDDADVEFSIEGVPVEFLNAESSLANKGLMLISGDDATVDLVVSMPRNYAYHFDLDRVRVIADLNSINTTGTQTLSWSPVYPQGINTSKITLRSPSVRNVTVRVGELFRRDDVEIRCKLEGNVADGYVAGSVRLLPEYLEIWGQQSDVMKVNYAQVTLNIANARSTIVELVEFQLFDYNDEPINNPAIHSASDTVQVTMPVISATDIPLVVSFVEEPGVRIDSFDYSLDVSSVTLSGDAAQIAQMGEIVLGEVVLSEITETQTITYDIPIPEGISNLSGITQSTLTISNRDLATRSMTISRFDYENFSAADRSVEVVTSSLPVTLRGAQETLDSLPADQMVAVADLSGVANASGTYTVPAHIRVEGAEEQPDIGTVELYQLTVRIAVPEASAAETEETRQTQQTQETPLTQETQPATETSETETQEVQP